MARGAWIQPFFSSMMPTSSSASSLVLTRMSSGTGLSGWVLSTGGLGTHTTITLFLPSRDTGIEACSRMLSRMFPVGGNKEQLSMWTLNQPGQQGEQLELTTAASGLQCQCVVRYPG